MLRFFFCLLALVSVGLGRPRQVVSKTVPDQFRALSLDKQKLTGLLGSRIRANSEGFLENIGPSELVRPVSEGTADSPSPDREFAGLFLDAAADAYEYNHDLQLRAQMDKVAEALASFARTAMPPLDAKLTAESFLDARADLVGLLAYYRVTEQPAALATAQAIGTALVKLLATDANRPGVPQGVLAAGQLGVVEPLVRLYRLSGDKRYLGACIALVKANGIPEITTDTPQADLASSLKALGSLADLYEVTGDLSYLRPVTLAWKRLVATRLSLAGAPLPRENGTSTDAATAAAWLQLTFKLLRITGEPGYGDQLERSIYNQVLAAQDGRNGNISPEIPLNGTKVFSSQLTASSGRAMLSEAKALALLPQLVWGRYDNGIAINLYSPGRAFFTLRKHGLVQIYSEGAFPQTGQLQLHVEPSVKTARFPLRLRVPSWTDNFIVDIADLHLKGRAGEVVIIDRDWKSGDTVRVTMNLPLRTHHGLLQASEASTSDLVLQRGPQVLALGKTLNPDSPNLSTVTVRPLSSGRYQIFNYEDKLPQSFFGDQVYRIAGDFLGKPHDLLLSPFADAVNYLVELRTQPD